MAVPNIKTINSCAAIKRGSTPIKVVVYNDGYSHPHEVWPYSTVLSDPQIVDLDGNDVYDYSYNSSTGEPNVYLKPDHHYAIKMTLTRRNKNQIQEEYTDCYLYHFTTTGHGDGSWTNTTNSELGYPDKPPRVSGGAYLQTAYGYSVYYCTEVESSNLQPWESLFGGVFRGDLDDFITTGYYGDDLYSTPIVLKRAHITDNFEIFDDPGYTDSSHLVPQSGGNVLQVNNSITVYPKRHKHAYDSNWGGNHSWDKYEIASISNISYDNSIFRVTANNDQYGSYTIEAQTYSGNPSDSVIFSCGNYTYSCTFTIEPQAEYRIAGITPGTDVTFTTARTLVIEQCNNFLDEEQDQIWTTYTGSNCSVTSSNESVILVSTTNNKRLIPVTFGGNSNITVTVESQVITFRAVTPPNPTVYYRTGTMNNNYEISYSGISQILGNDSTATWNTYVTNAFVINFATDQSFNSGLNVNFNGSSITTQNEDRSVYVGGQDDGVFTFTLNNSLQRQDTLVLDVWLDENQTNKVGTITISMWN